ncbi:FMN-dependent NADH-azoreductase [Actinomadura litoris]|uniref:FMN dependent NADH:quinone oxidoreductase n=1 Tax=Actinomadura litoris TaxID=2678616 RepID=A0A7K1L1E1_9ACTN|nr:NAD(P)H-dependent oxidoreductase [Actinomadura litoris]MUN38123.1 NAD(P)H dehydrogenase [Actinomadura litoris]
MTLLHLDSSHSGDSITRRLTGLFADTWTAANGRAGYRYRNLATDPAPPLTAAYCALGRRVESHGLVPPEKVAALVEDPAEEREWALTLPLIEEVHAADTILLGVPMYNYSVPASLKAWIDRITFPGAYMEDVLRGTRAVVVTARGGAYGPGTPNEALDFQEPYLRAYFGRLGLSEDDVHFANAEMTLTGLVPHLARFKQMTADSLAAAQEKVKALGAVL